MDEQKGASAGDRRLVGRLAILTFTRLIINTALRMPYPFLPAFARGLGVPRAEITHLLALRSAAGLLSPLFVPLVERFGRRVVLAGAMVVFGLGSLVVVIWPAFWPLGLALVVTGLVKVVYDPVMQGYLGDVVVYERRGRALAVTEFAWGGSLLLGAPLVAVAISRGGWQAPFLWLGLLGLGAAVLLWRTMPNDRPVHRQSAGIRGVWSVIRRHPVMWAAASYILLAMAANEILFVVYAQWMEIRFDLAITGIGLASSVIGGAEIGGELFAGWSVDRLGKRPIIISAGLLTGLMYFLIPTISITLPLALITLFLVFLAFEITIVGGLPLMSEVVPAARTIMLSVVLAAASLGRMVGDLVSQPLWQLGGIDVNARVAAVIMWLGVLILVLWVREGSSDRAAVDDDLI